MILSALRIIGITLLAIIGILLLIVLIILFVPVRYKVYGEKERDDSKPLYASAKVFWLLHIISACYEYRDNDTGFTIRVFGIRLKSAKEREERRKRKRVKDKSKKDAADTACTMLEYDDRSGSIKEKRIEAAGKTHVFVDEHEESSDVIALPKVPPKHDADDKEPEPKKGLSDRISDLKNRVLKPAAGLFERLKDIHEKTDYYYGALVNDAGNREAINLIINKAKRLLIAIAPRRTRGQVEYGSDDPSDTGRFLALAALIYPLYGPDIEVVPCFDDKMLAFELMMKGRIYIFTVAVILLQLYFNKKVKRFIHIMKKENADG